jgi:glutaredoxin
MAFFSRVILPFLLLTYISLETYLKLQDSSLCANTGCKLAGDLLRFDPLYLNYFGLAGVLSLFVFGYFSLKSKLLEKLFFIVLYAAIAFEATIISYQFIANPEPCIFCLGIFSSLLLIALFSRLKSFVVVLAVVLSIFVGINTLAIAKNKSFATSQGLYLIQSKGCAHCKKVKKFFAQKEIKYTPISVTEVNARLFLKFVDISIIPVLIIKEETGITVLSGDEDIIYHFESTEAKVDTVPVLSEPSPVSSSVSAIPSGLFGATSGSGCAITITEAPACDNTDKGH